jgi:peroxiredoxin
MAWRRAGKPLAAGATAPPFELPGMDGAAHASSDLLARGPVLLAVYKIGCPTCQLTLPFLERLHQAGGALQIVGISQDNRFGTERFQSTYQLTLPSLLDREEDGYRVSNAFGIARVPALFLIEPDGVISMAVEGFSKAELEAIGRRAGVEPFRPGENVPEWKPG